MQENRWPFGSSEIPSVFLSSAGTWNPWEFLFLRNSGGVHWF
jgi:hypothetical protein